MAFSQIAALAASRCDGLLSADNMAKDRLSVITLLRQAAPLLGLKAPLIATLDALLSCLPASRNHHVVFASNATISFRRDGICERSLRRHFAQLQELGLLRRQDSPNGKRFSRYNPQTEMALRFGFDLSPLFARLPQLAALAHQAQQERDARHYLKLQILDLLAEHGDAAAALTIKTMLRRKLSLPQLQAILQDLQKDNGPSAKEMPCTDGQNVRHHHKTEKDNIDNRTPVANEDTAEQTVEILLKTCPEAQEFALAPVRTLSDVIRHAESLAPMLGISHSSYQRAALQKGAVATAVTLWLMMRDHHKIRHLAGYFQSLLLGRHAADFDPIRQLYRIGRAVVRGQPTPDLG